MSEPRRPDGTLDLARIAAQLSLQMHPIGSALTACATHLFYIRELLPARGELVDEFRGLVSALEYIDRAYHGADERLTSVAFAIDMERVVPAPLPLRESA